MIEPSATCSTPTATAFSSSTTALRTAPARSPTGSPPSCPWVYVLHRQTKEGIGPAYIAGFRRALADGAELVLEMDCDFSHDPADVPRLIAASDTADLVLGSRYVARRRHGQLGAGPQDRVARRLPVRAKFSSACACATSPVASSAFAGPRSKRSTSTRVSANGYGFQIETTYRVRRRGPPDRRGADHLRGPPRRRVEDDGSIVAEAMWKVPLPPAPRALTGKL